VLFDHFPELFIWYVYVVGPAPYPSDLYPHYNFVWGFQEYTVYINNPHTIAELT
jgi:hypothetical protein